MCVVTASCRRYSVDLPQGGLEIPCLLKFEGEEKYATKVKALVKYTFTMTPSMTSSENVPPKEKEKAGRCCRWQHSY